MSTHSAAVTRTNAAGKLLFVCLNCDESIGYADGSPSEKLVHVTTGNAECQPTTYATKKLVELASVVGPSLTNPTPKYTAVDPTLLPFSVVVKELTTYYAEPHRSPSGKPKPDKGCKYCGRYISWDGEKWIHLSDAWVWHDAWKQCQPKDIKAHRGE